MPGCVLSSCSACFSAFAALQSGHVCHHAPQTHSVVSRALQFHCSSDGATVGGARSARKSERSGEALFQHCDSKLALHTHRAWRAKTLGAPKDRLRNSHRCIQVCSEPFKEARSNTRTVPACSSSSRSSASQCATTSGERVKDSVCTQGVNLRTPLARMLSRWRAPWKRTPDLALTPWPSRGEIAFVTCIDQISTH
jgi:hypothetical protein